MMEGSSLAWPVLGNMQSILCIGAHADDIEIGCAGTLLSIAEVNPDAHVTFVVVAPGDETRKSEAKASAERFSPRLTVDLVLGDFRERYLPYQPAVKEFFDGLGAEHTPDVVFCPRVDDMHQDHSTLAKLTWNTFRQAPILEYEIAKYEGDLGRPNVYVPLDSSIVDLKVDHLMESFPTQRQRHWYRPETFRALATIRGVECKSESGFAEAFHARKTVLR